MHSAGDVFSMEALYIAQEENLLFSLAFSFHSHFESRVLISSWHLCPKSKTLWEILKVSLWNLNDFFFFRGSLPRSFLLLLMLLVWERMQPCLFVEQQKPTETGNWTTDTWKKGSMCTGGRETRSPRVQAHKGCVPSRHPGKGCDRWTGMKTQKIWVREAK